ncbi:MAG: hypothetical protein JJE21_10955 [Spirochaetaceae bacterium]|nr:hypothetical protein [Spirochaetaceae bacterium]
MTKKYKLGLLFFTLFALLNINLYADSQFEDTSIYYTSVGGAFQYGTGTDKTVSLPIEEYYTPPNSSSLPKFKLKSQSSDEIGYSFLENPVRTLSSYQTDYYELGEVKESEHFFLTYSGTSKSTEKYYIDIYYLPNFYSKVSGTEKNKTNININLNVNWLYNSNNGVLHKFYRTVDNKISDIRYPYNTSDHYRYSEFYLHIANKYQYIPNMLEFYFTWNTTTLKAINDFSSDNNNGYQFVGHQPVSSNVIFSVTSD